MAGKQSQARLFTISRARLTDIGQLKKLADRHKRELSFVFRAALLEGIRNRYVYIAKQCRSSRVVGFVHFRHKKDKTTKIYQICVEHSARNTRVGTSLLDTLRKEAIRLGNTSINLKCPADLPANLFYTRYGFELEHTVSGKRRRLCLWKYDLT